MEINEIENQLETRYFLIKKNSFWYFFGGAIVTLVMLLGISYSNLSSQIRELAGDEALKKINNNVTESSKILDRANQMLIESKWKDYPIGTIVAFSGDRSTIDFEQWRLCDGTKLSRETYKELWTVIGTSWGLGDGETTFELPDLRGVFLRGADYGAKKDPEAQERKNKREKLGEVGSYQDDSYKKHYHTLREKHFVNHGEHPNIELKSGPGSAISVSENETTTVDGGSETRPKNAYVNWIIKIK